MNVICVTETINVSNVKNVTNTNETINVSNVSLAADKSRGGEQESRGTSQPSLASRPALGLQLRERGPP